MNAVEAVPYPVIVLSGACLFFATRQCGGPPAATEGKSCKDFAAELCLFARPHTVHSPQRVLSRRRATPGRGPCAAITSRGVPPGRPSGDCLSARRADGCNRRDLDSRRCHGIRHGYSRSRASGRQAAPGCTSACGACNVHFPTVKWVAMIAFARTRRRGPRVSGHPWPHPDAPPAAWVPGWHEPPPADQVQSARPSRLPSSPHEGGGPSPHRSGTRLAPSQPGLRPVVRCRWCAPWPPAGSWRLPSAAAATARGTVHNRRRRGAALAKGRGGTPASRHRRGVGCVPLRHRVTPPPTCATSRGAAGQSS